MHRFRQLSVFSTCLTVDATNEPVGRFYYQMKSEVGITGPLNHAEESYFISVINLHEI